MHRSNCQLIKTPFTKFVINFKKKFHFFLFLSTMQVASIVGRAESMAALCFLFAISKHVQSSVTPSIGSSLCNVRLLITFAWAVVGMLCKEQAITSLPVCICCLYLQAARTKNKQNRATCLRQAGVLLIGFLIAIQFRFSLNGTTTNPTFSKNDNPIEQCSLAHRLWIVARLAIEAFKLTLFPLHLTCDRSFGYWKFTPDREGMLYAALLVTFGITCAAVATTRRRTIWKQIKRIHSITLLVG